MLDKGDTLNVYMPGGKRYSGELRGLTPGELELELQNEQVVNLMLTDVERVDLKKRSFLLPTLLVTGTGAATRCAPERSWGRSGPRCWWEWGSTTI